MAFQVGIFFSDRPGMLVSHSWSMVSNLAVYDHIYSTHQYHSNHQYHSTHGSDSRHVCHTSSLPNRSSRIPILLYGAVGDNEV